MTQVISGPHPAVMRDQDPYVIVKDLFALAY
ncbi:IS116/IS110/IS902-like transposase [Thermacetogenium phaeum DSM 12270]|uniref:IS116/IS110/IS902-like transposase n=1 Tax=Thermacetogenium phaeum (strain ATCC BAA-254 / DSM 26808 / PB) TaxID=1089553 RepID=K4LJP1_THEPS|nr:IS116/IS110/IS902-like transposase [Thermacetogenium phaeum DSM 12270]